MKKCLLMILFGCVLGVNAAEFTVTTTDDTIDASLADGVCLDSKGECSLRAAIMQTNILGTDDMIYLARGEAYELTNANDIDGPNFNDLDIFHSVTISIADPETPIQSLNEMPTIFAGTLVNDRVFEIHDGELVVFKGLVIAYGDATDSLQSPRQGGGIYVSEQVGEFRMSDSIVSFNRAHFGAGIYSKATVTWIESTDISYNQLDTTAVPIFNIAGAGIYHVGTELTLNKSSVHNNSLDSIGWFPSALQFDGPDSQVNILNTLVADNGVSPFIEGTRVDGIRFRYSNVYINNSNITGNTGFGIRFDTTEIDGDDHSLFMRNSVLAFNQLNNCNELTGEQDFGDVSDPAHIIISDDSCELPDLVNNLEDIDPNLSSLKGRFQVLDYQFFSHQFPMPGSVLIDAGSPLNGSTGNPSACEPTDIRDFVRPEVGASSGVCDVGIYESDLIFIDGFDLVD